jgi:hypothetical protein
MKIHAALLAPALVSLLLASPDAASGQSQERARPGILLLHDLVGGATVDGADPAPDIPATVEWRFDRPQAGWRLGPYWRETVAPAEVAPVDDALRVTLPEAAPHTDGLTGGGIYVDLPDLDPEEWGEVEIRARTSDEFWRLGIVMNLARSVGAENDASFPFRVWGGYTPVISDGTVQVYRLRLTWPRAERDRPWTELGVYVAAPAPARMEILSVRLLAKETPYVGAPAGVRPVGDQGVPAVYLRAPGRIEYDVAVPDAGRLDVALGVLREDAPVTFRVLASPEQGQSQLVLEETHGDPQSWLTRSLDLSPLAGQTIRLSLEAESERPGTVALWRAPALYTPSRLSVRILDDGTGRPTPVRARLTHEYGVSAPLPDTAIGIMWGRNDYAEGFGFQRDSAFYADGGFEAGLQPGTYQLSVMKGQEYLVQDHTLELSPGEERSETFRLERWIDMPSRGWFSADDHIHLRRSPREDPLILKWIAAEDIHVGALLQMGDAWTGNYFAQYAWGRDGVYQVEDYFLASGQEDPRTHEIGHTISLAADDHVRFAGQYYHYDRVFDRVRELGGLSGYAHKGVAFYGYRGLTLDVLRDKVDFLELLQFGEMTLDHYYHFLDLGFKLTATAGSDFPWATQIGDARFYTYVGDDFNFENWREALRRGHTFVSNGPVIKLTVNDRIPGEEVRVSDGTVLEIRARAEGHPAQVALEKLEIVAHGTVMASTTAGEPGQSKATLSIRTELPVQHGIWIAARCEGADGKVAHTTPVYVTVDGGGFHNPETALGYLDLNETYLQELEEEIAERKEEAHLNAWRYREGLEERIAEARQVIAELRQRFGGTSTPQR